VTMAMALVRSGTVMSRYFVMVHRDPPGLG
jgi:hypothetical protein